MRSFNYFTSGHELAYYSRARFHVRAARLFFKGKLLGRLAFHIARLWPAWYEDHLTWSSRAGCSISSSRPTSEGLVHLPALFGEGRVRWR